MSLFDRINDANEKRKEKAKKLSEERGKPYLLGMCDYIGGLDGMKESNGTVGIYENKVEFKSTRAKFEIDMSDVTEILVEGHDEISKRVTATRLLAFGIFAFAMKKKTKDQDAYVSFLLSSGEQGAFHFNKVAPISLRTKLATLVAKVKKP